MVCLCATASAEKGVVKLDGCFYEYDTDTGEATCVKPQEENYVYPSEITIADNITVDGKIYPVTTIGMVAFYESNTISSVKFGANIKWVHPFVFAKTSIRNVTFNNKLELIGDGAFSQCKLLEHVDFPLTETNIFILGELAFAESGIKSIFVRRNMDLDMSSLACPECEKLVFEEGFGNLYYYSIFMPKIDSLEFPGSIMLGDGCLGSMKHLKKITINELTGDKERQLIDKNIFWVDEGYRESSLEEFVCHNTTPPVVDEAMLDNNTFARCVLRVPDGSVEAYRNAPGWRNFVNIQGIASVEDIATENVEVVSTEYYDLTGRRVLNLENNRQVLIKKAKMSDGSVRITKDISR